MTDLMQYLYDYTLENRFSHFLTGGEYRDCGVCIDRQREALHAQLPQEQWHMVEKFWDMREQQHAIELEAMFEATVSLARELR